MIFVHNHFPGPFRPLAQKFGEQEKSMALFLSEHCDRSLRLPGVRRLRLPVVAERADGAAGQAAGYVRRAEFTANALLRLRRDGFTPAFVYSSASGGYGLYGKDVFPDALHVSRVNWFHDRNGRRLASGREGRPPRLAEDFASAQVGNLFQYNALLTSDMAVATSQWQKEQYPPELRSRIRVIPDGVDTRFFSPAPGRRFVCDELDLAGVTELVTFSRRRTGPAVGLAAFAGSLPHIFSLRPGCHALIMVEDKEEAERTLAAVSGPDLAGRAHVIGFSTVHAYRALLRASTVHVYGTAPFTLSAALFEAMSCGALLAGSDTPPVREIVRHGVNGFLVDVQDVRALGETVVELLARAPRFASIREEARRTVVRDYDLETQTARHQEAVMLALRGGRREE
jgi:glycosyltransferase involved in cell wall biosynthesis